MSQPTSSSVRISRIALIMLFSVMSLSFSLILVTLGDGWGRLLTSAEAAGIVAFLAGCGVFFWEYYRKKDLFSIPCFAATVFLAFYGLGYWLSLMNLRDGWLQFPVPEEMLALAEWLSVGGFLAWYAGYLMVYWLVQPRRRRSAMKKLPQSLTTPRIWQFLWGSLLLMVGAAAFIVFVVRSGGVPGLQSRTVSSRFDAVTGIGWIIMVMSWIPTISLALFFGRTPKRWRLWTWCLALCGLMAGGIFSFATSNRSAVVNFVFLSIVLYHYLVRRLKLMQFAGLIGVSLVLVGMLGLFRLGWSFDFLSFVNFQRVTLFNHVSAFAVVLKNVPEIIPYAKGVTFVNAILYFVPHALWIDKPTSSAGALFKQMGNLSFQGGGLAITFPGELYWNAGAWAIPVVMMLIGMVCGCLMRWFENTRRDVWNVMIYFTSMYSLSLLMPGESFVLVSLLLNLIQLWLFKFLFRLRAARQASTRGASTIVDSR